MSSLKLTPKDPATEVKTADTPPKNDNMKTWDFLGETDPNFTKPITGKRFSGTAINPTYCYKKMTEQYGPCGIGWKYEVTKRTVHDAPDGQLILFVDVALYIKNGMSWSDPIPGVGGNMIFDKQVKGMFLDDEAYKKATTDALTNAMKFIGMSADVHTGLYDDSKYVAGLKEEHGDSRVKDETPAPAPLPQKPAANSIFNTAEEIAAWAAAGPEKIAEFQKLGTGRRAAWLKTAATEIKALASVEAIARWKNDHKNHLSALGVKQGEWLDAQIADRLKQVVQTPVDILEDEIPF